MGDTQASDYVIGDTVDRRYVLKREIARGGAGTVFEAVHAITTRTVAIKLLHSTSRNNPEICERLLLEARALATVRHPNVVEVLDAGLDRTGEPYLVMEMLEGRPLDGILASRRTLDVSDVVHIARQICDALAFMHARGVVHRDLKPSNVFVTRDEIGQETVKVVDFGIASLPSDWRPNQLRLTAPGGVYGTAEYMAPEQLVAMETVEPRCDQYSLGVLMYEALSGEVPHTGTYPEILLKVSSKGAPPSVQSRRPDVAAPLSEVIARLLSRAASQRFADALEVSGALITATGLPTGRTALLGVFRPLPGVRAAVAARPTVVVPDPAPARLEAARRRRFSRAPYLTPLRLILSGGATLDARSEDISEGGLLAMADRGCAVDQKVDARFALPTSGEIVTVAAVVRWVRPARNRIAIGLEFSELEWNVRGSIAAYVALMHPGHDASGAESAKSPR